MRKRKLLVSFLLTILIVLSSVALCLADEKIDFRQTRIARVAFIEGDANLQRQGAEQLDSAILNVPVFTGDLIYTNPNSRMELELYGGFIRLSETTSLELVKFTPKLYRFDLSLGLATFSFSDESPEIEIATPQAAISLKQGGIYRIKVDLDGTTEIVVQEGQAEVFGRTSTFKLHKDKRAFFSPTNNVTVTSFDFRDDWDRWNNEREHLISVNSVNGFLKPRPHLYGSSLLNQHGRWINVQGYGFVWKPNNLSANWAPYRIGRWAFYRTSGWTWISQEAWGWLPYHYGYWIYLSAQGWVWVPRDLDWFWSPALVTWYNVNWNNNYYACWHPRTDYWPNNGNNGNNGNWNNGDGTLVYNLKGKFPVNTNHEGTLSPRDLISGVTIDTLASGSSSPKEFNYTDVTVSQVNSAVEILQPNTQGIATDSNKDKVFRDLLSRPLVTKLGNNDENPRRKYDSPKGSISTSSSVPKDSVSNSSSHDKKLPRTIDNEPKAKLGSVNNNSLSNSNNSGSSVKSSMHEKIHNEPKVHSSPTISSPSINTGSSIPAPRDGGGHRGGGGGGRSKQ
ncbi:MAG: hypothetical protein HY819_00195 [Acidobacteria bacterium]|nr:hypothetical protein [Acidobacteriota bacterium]